MKNPFNFIPAHRFNELFAEIPVIYFYPETYYYQLRGVLYIISDGWHIATKSGCIISYNDLAKISPELKKAIKGLKLNQSYLIVPAIASGIEPHFNN